MSSTPGIFVRRSASDEAFAWLRRARRVSPSSPKSERWIVNARQQRPELVQMLLVAFSRRICCSRVESVSTYPRGLRHPRFRRRGGPASGAGISRAWRRGRHKVRRNSGRCRWTGLRLPRCPRLVRRAVRGDQARQFRCTTAMSNAPFAWAASAIGRRSRMRPNTSGLCTTTHAVLIVDHCGDVFGSAGRDRRANDLALQRSDSFDGLGVMRMQAAGEDCFGAARDALGHQHGFCGRRRAVIHRGVGDFHAGEKCHLRLEFKKVLQCALRDFRLIGRVGGEEFRTLDQMIDSGRNMVAICACAAEERHRSSGRALRGASAAKRAFDSQARLWYRADRMRQRLTTAAFGTSRKSASISGAPIFASIAVRSCGVSGW